MKRYEYLEHTGDIGIRAYGGTLKELFINAAQGLLEAIADLTTDRYSDAQTEIEVSAESLEELMVAWLDELNFRHEVEEVFFQRQLRFGKFPKPRIGWQQLPMASQWILRNTLSTQRLRASPIIN